MFAPYEDSKGATVNKGENNTVEKGGEKGEPIHTKGSQAAQFQEREPMGFTIQKQSPSEPSMSTLSNTCLWM